MMCCTQDATEVWRKRRYELEIIRDSVLDHFPNLPVFPIDIADDIPNFRVTTIDSPEFTQGTMRNPKLKWIHSYPPSRKRLIFWGCISIRIICG